MIQCISVKNLLLVVSLTWNNNLHSSNSQLLGSLLSLLSLVSSTIKICLWDHSISNDYYKKCKKYMLIYSEITCQASETKWKSMSYDAGLTWYSSEFLKSFFLWKLHVCTCSIKFCNHFTGGEVDLPSVCFNWVQANAMYPICSIQRGGKLWCSEGWWDSSAEKMTTIMVLFQKTSISLLRMALWFQTQQPNLAGNSSFGSGFPLKVLAFETPSPLKFS